MRLQLNQRIHKQGKENDKRIIFLCKPGKWCLAKDPSICLKIENMAFLSTDVGALSRLNPGINIFLSHDYCEIV